MKKDNKTMIELQEANWIETEQGTPEWLELRQNKIGASDSASILGIGYNSIEELYAIKTGKKKVFVNSAMRRGSKLEPVARKQFEKEMGATFSPAVYVSKKYPWLMASLDGINESGTAILEIKCGGDKLHMDAMAGIVPPYYYSQMQHQLAVTGIDTCYYYSFDGEDSGAMILIKRDEKYIADYLPKAKAFWDSIQSFTPPLYDDAPVPVTGDKMKQLRDQYVAIMNAKRELEEQEKQVKEALQELANGNNITGYGLTMKQVTREGSIEYSKIPELFGLNLDVYRKPSTQYWKITVDKE